MAGPAKIIEVSLTWLLAGLFLHAGVLKLLQPGGFLSGIQSYQLLPYQVAYGVAYYLPALEIIAAAGLLWPRFRLESSGILAFLTLVFLVALGSAWARGLDISCGCFGKSDIKADYPLLMGRDLLILAGCGIIFHLRRKVPRNPHGALKWPELKKSKK